MSLDERPVISPVASEDDRLRERLDRAKDRLKSLQTITKASTERVPATALQRQIWFANDLAQSVPLNHRPVVLDFHGSLHIQALRDAIERLVERHSILRQCFDVADGHVVLAPAHTAGGLRIDTIPLESWETEIEHVTFDEIVAPFDLHTGPLMRSRLLTTHGDHHRVIVTFHHAVFDGWSESIFVRELREEYAAFVEGRSSRLRELSIQYADFAAWQFERLNSPEAEAHRDYWRDQLRDAPGLFALPYDSRRPASMARHGAAAHFVWEKSFSDRLERWARSVDATLFMTLMAGFQSLLYRYTLQPDLVVGTYTSGRSTVELESLIGQFAGPLPLRVKMSDEMSFFDVLNRSRAVMLDAFSHQSTPYSQMLLDMRPRRNFETEPLFQCVLQLRNYDGMTADDDIFCSGSESEPLAFRRVDVDLRCSELDLSIDFRLDNDGLSGRAQFSTEVFDRPTVDRLVDRFRRLLEAAIDQPHEPIGRLTILGEDERHLVVDTWNETTVAWRDLRCLHEYVEEQVRKTPDAEAVVCEHRRLTYEEVNRRSNQLAHRLIERGVAAESLVAVSLEPSPELIIALLAVLKAGGAYVPIEPDLPRERVRFLLDDTAAEIAIADVHTAAVISECRNGLTIVDPGDATLERYPATDPQRSADLHQAAYVIYTSGSTGQPKGVVVEHTNIVNHMLWFQKEYCFGPSDRILQQTPFGFDVSLWELFVPLMCGATEVMAKPDGHRDTRYLVDLIRREQIGTAHFVPAMLRYFLMMPDLEHCTSLKRILCSGEALPFDLIQQTASQLNVEVHNLYGPTEAAVHVTGCRCFADDRRGIVTIGKPLANCRVYVLDQAGRPAPVGIPGELYLGGVQVARGYLNRPELTRERFVPDPFSPIPEARMYKTGDLTRWLPDGEIEFLGRIDHQIKVHGVRIEAGEVEAALNTLNGVQASVVVTRETSAGSNQMIAYVVPADGERPSGHDLRNELRHRLPATMIPSYFVEIDRIPLTSSGKVDRKALPAPIVQKPVADRKSSQPSTPTEAALLAIWKNLLELESCDLHADFFDLGGDSMQAIGMFLDIEKQIGVRIPATAILRHPTIVELAAEIDRATSLHDHVVELRAGDDRTPLFFVHTLGGQLMYARNIIEHLDEAQPVFGFQQPSSADELSSIADFASLARRYVDELRSIQTRGPYRLAGYSFGGHLAYEMARQLREAGETVSLLAIIDTGVRLSQFGISSNPISAMKIRRFWTNLPYWFRDDFMQGSPRSRWYRLQRRMRRMGKRCLHWCRLRSAPASLRRIEDIFSDEEILPQLRPSMEKNLDLLNRHRQGRYDGPLTLFKAHARPLFEVCPLEDGWAKLVAGSMTIYELPGNHDGILRPPSVITLAKALQSRLDTTCQGSHRTAL